MVYYVAYDNDRIVEFSFYPRWCTSDGATNDKLGTALFSTFRILPQWRLADDGRLIRKLGAGEYISYPQSVKQLVEESQQLISNMMDEIKNTMALFKAKHVPGI